MGSPVTVKTTSIDLKTLVQMHEGKELTKMPIVYYWPSGKNKRDSGSNSGIYEPTTP